MLRCKHALILCLLLLLAPATAGGKEWSWRLTADQYKGLTSFQRAQYDKASRLCKEQNWKGAAAEFKKFKVEFGATLDKAMLGYVVFMRGYCLHRAHFRHEAIKIYQEVLDYFDDNLDIGPPALYYMGEAYFANGDLRDGMECMLEMVEDPEYSKHPLAAGALNRLADNHWKNDEREKAVEYWKRVCSFWSGNRDEARDAFYKVIRYYLANGQLSAYEEWRLNDENREDAKHRRNVAHNAHEGAYQVLRTGNEWFGQFDQEKLGQRIGAYFTWFKGQRDWYEKADDLWTYYRDGLTFLAHRYRRKEEVNAFSDAFFAWVGARQDAKDRDGKLDWAVDRFAEMGRWDRAAHCIGMMADRPRATYKEYQVEARRNRWKEAVKKLQDLQQMGSASWARRARWDEAHIYHHRLGQYEKAIKIYHEFDPPRNLWEIQDCYVRWRKLESALSTLTEIGASFPKEAPRAAWRKAELFHSAGQKEKAIAACRTIMKKWPASGESSRAHQLLEKLGVENIGGGLHRAK